MSATGPLWRTATPRRLIVGLVFGVLLAASVSAGELYRWVDDDGLVHYSDRIPPEAIRHSHTQITNTGVPIETVPAAKSPEELRRERALEQLRAEQQQLIAEQQAADDLLLRTYQTVDDIYLARDNKVSNIASMVAVTRSRIRQQQMRLMSLYAQAADSERAGKDLPGHLRTRIDATERAISDAYAEILTREQQKQALRESYARDIERYQQILERTQRVAAHQTKRQPEVAEVPQLKNLVTCANATECNRRWSLAVSFVRDHAMTPVHLAGDDLIVTAAPTTSEELGLILSRTPDEDGEGASLFLDVQCYRGVSQDEGCQDNWAAEILDAFQLNLDEDRSAER